jgi:hypothetical protein
MTVPKMYEKIANKITLHKLQICYKYLRIG